MLESLETMYANVSFVVITITLFWILSLHWYGIIFHWLIQNYIPYCIWLYRSIMYVAASLFKLFKWHTEKPRTHFARLFHSISLISWKIQLTAYQIVKKWSLQKFAHIMTTGLSWHMQTFVVILCLENKLQQNEPFIKSGFGREIFFVKWTRVAHSFAKGLNCMTNTLGNLVKAGRWDGGGWLWIIYGMSYSYVCMSPRQVLNHSRQFETSWVITEMNGKLPKWAMSAKVMDWLIHLVSKSRHLIVKLILKYHASFQKYCINSHPDQYNKHANVQMQVKWYNAAAYILTQ